MVADRPAWELMYERSAGYGGTWGKIRETIGPESNVSHTRIEWLLVPDPWFRGRIIVINEAVAAHCAHGQGRLHGLGTLPLQHPAIAVRELERAVGKLGLKGVSVSTNVDRRELADPLFTPVWEAAADLGAVVFIHPWGAASARGSASTSSATPSASRPRPRWRCRT